jgi:hypothetical protein
MKYLLKSWQDSWPSWDQQIDNKLHEIDHLVVKTPWSCITSRKEQLVLTRSRIDHGRFTHTKCSLLLNNDERQECIHLKVFRVILQLFTKTCLNLLRRCYWYSSDFLPCLDYILKTGMKFIILVSNLKKISPSVFSWKKDYVKNYDAILLSKYDSAETRY